MKVVGVVKGKGYNQKTESGPWQAPLGAEIGSRKKGLVRGLRGGQDIRLLSRMGAKHPDLDSKTVFNIILSCYKYQSHCWGRQFRPVGKS